MRKKILFMLNSAMSMLAILLLGFGLAIYCFYFDMTKTAVTDSTENDRMLQHVALFCYVTFSVNGFLFMLSIFGHVSRWLNKRVCFLVLMVFVFASAIVLLVILGLSVGLFSSFVPSLNAPTPQYQRSVKPEPDGDFEEINDKIMPAQKSDVTAAGQPLAYHNLKKFIIIYMLNIGFHLLLLIVTGIVSTILYCGKTNTPNTTSPAPKSNLSRLYPVDQAKRTFTSQSFHYAGFHDTTKGHLHERLSPTYELNATNFDIVQNRGVTDLQNRKLPDLPDAKFNPVHSTARRNPLSVRSAPNLHRLENVILVNESPIPKTDDSSGESNFNERSPLIRKSQKYV